MSNSAREDRRKLRRVQMLLAITIAITILIFAVGIFFLTRGPQKFDNNPLVTPPAPTTTLPPKTIGPPQPLQYAIIIDAGSTGTRVHVFEMDVNHEVPELKRELYHPEEPGLADLKPEEAGNQVKILIGKAAEFVPPEAHQNTTVRLKATAGFRFIEQKVAGEIFKAVRKTIENSTFFVEENYAEVMNGAKEGIASWFTINFLRNKMLTAEKITALDLGGGSTQVSFEVLGNPPANLRESIVKVYNFYADHNLYVNSYLNLGLMALRQQVITKGADENSQNLVSSCIHANQEQFTWTYRNSVYSINPKTDSNTYEDCVTSIRSIVDELLQPKVPSLEDKNINAFSYFMERAVDAGILSGDEGVVKVGKYKEKALEFCNGGKSDDPWLCLDMTYMYVLLSNGYILSDKKEITLVKKINEREASWALGIYLQEYIKKQRGL